MVLKNIFKYLDFNQFLYKENFDLFFNGKYMNKYIIILLLVPVFIFSCDDECRVNKDCKKNDFCVAPDAGGYDARVCKETGNRYCVKNIECQTCPEKNFCGNNNDDKCTWVCEKNQCIITEDFMGIDGYKDKNETSIRDTYIYCPEIKIVKENSGTCINQETNVCAETTESECLEGNVLFTAGEMCPVE